MSPEEITAVPHSRSAEVASATIQMAIDSHLLSRASEVDSVCFRVYRMSPPAVTIGRHQRWQRVIDPERCRLHGWEWARRPTGGGALLHRDEINYAVVARRGLLAPQGRGEFRAAFETIGAALSAALRGLGFEPRFSSGERRESLLQHGLCGRSITGSEIAVDGRKLIAAAQVIAPGGILQHGTVYLRSPEEDGQFWPDADCAAEDEFRQRWADLGAAIGGRPWEEIAEQLSRGFSQNLTSSTVPAVLSELDWRAVDSIGRRWSETGWPTSR